MTNIAIDYDDKEAARYLAQGLADLARVEAEKQRYEYELPYSVTEDEARAVRLIKSAVQTLMRAGQDDA